MNLSRLPQPRKTAEECALDQLPEPGREVLYDNLFERKRVKGWWPVYSEEEGERLLNVSISILEKSFVMFCPIYDLCL